MIGDGGYVIALERRGYVKAGHWTPEAAVEHPDAGRNDLISFTYEIRDHLRLKTISNQ